nr:hypothetical protein [Tanacetum cinerariifolium]
MRSDTPFHGWKGVFILETYLEVWAYKWVKIQPDTPLSTVTSEERANPQLSSGMSAFNLNKPIFSASFIIYSESASGCKALADSIVEAEPRLYSLKLEDLLDILKDTRSAFFTPDSLPDKPIIVSDESEKEEEVEKDKDTKATSYNSQKEKLEKAKAEAEVASMKAKPLYLDFNQLTELLVTSLKPKLSKLLASYDFASLLHKVTDTLKRFATTVENASGATSMNVPSVGKANASPAKGEKNTKDADPKDELVDLLGKNVMTQYYTTKLLIDKYCDKMLKRKKSHKITNCKVLTNKGHITLKIYREDGSDEVISNLKGLTFWSLESVFLLSFCYLDCDWTSALLGDCGVTHGPYQCQSKNHDYYNEQNSCYDSNSFGFNHGQPPRYTVNHPIFNAHNDLLNANNDLLNSQNEITIAQNKIMEQLTSMCAMVGQLIEKKHEEKQIKEEQAANARYSKIPICYDDDDDYNSAIIPNEPVDYLSMRDEHLNTISATESNEFIKSSVENLVLNPSESEGKSECDMPAYEAFTTFSNVLFDVDYDFYSSDDQSFSDEDIDSLFDEFAGEHTLLKSIPLGIDETDCYPEEETYFTKRLLYDNSSPRPPEEILFANSNADIESFCPSLILIKDSDSLMEEIDLYFTLDDPMPAGIELDDPMPAGIEEDDYDSEGIF